MKMNKIALVIGATGATGRELVSALLADADFSRIVTFGRSAPKINHPKLTAHVIDFDKPELWSDLVRGDVAFSCLGTTLKAAGSKEAQKKIDVDYQYLFAQAARMNEVEDFILVSSYGADPSSKLFYPRMKGELEERIRALNFERLTFFQPGMLERPASDRPMEVFGAKIIKLFNGVGLFKAQKPLPTKILAQAMINAAKIKSNGFAEIKLGAIAAFAAKNP